MSILAVIAGVAGGVVVVWLTRQINPNAPVIGGALVAAAMISSAVTKWLG